MADGIIFFTEVKNACKGDYASLAKSAQRPLNQRSYHFMRLYVLNLLWAAGVSPATVTSQRLYTATVPYKNSIICKQNDVTSWYLATADNLKTKC